MGRRRCSLAKVERVMIPRSFPFFTRTMPLDLPLQVVELCLAELDNDTLGLQACSLVHSSWTRIAQYLLFSQAIVKVGRDPDLYQKKMYGPITYPATRLYELALQSPYVASCIREVDYDLADAARATRTPHLQSRSVMDVLRPLVKLAELRHLRLRNRIPRTLEPSQAMDLSAFHVLNTLELSDAGLRDLKSLETIISSLPALRNLFMSMNHRYKWTGHSKDWNSTSSSQVALEHVKIRGARYGPMLTKWLFTGLLDTPTATSLVRFDTDQKERNAELDTFLAARDNMNLEFGLILRNQIYCE
jgi:hypothetical protein